MVSKAVLAGADPLAEGLERGVRSWWTSEATFQTVGKERLFNKHSGMKLLSPMKKGEMESLPRSTIKLNTKWIKTLGIKIKHETLTGRQR